MHNFFRCLAKDNKLSNRGEIIIVSVTVVKKTNQAS